MELRVYSPEMAFLSVIDDASSVIWTRRYDEPGEVQAVLPATDQNLSITTRGRLLHIRDATEAAVIEDREIVEGYSERKITVKGRFLSSYMDRRLIRPTYSFSGKVEVAMRTLISNAAAIPLVELGALQGFNDTVAFQATYKDLLKYETKLARCASLGYRFRPDFTSRKIYFEIYAGEDHSLSQQDRPRVIFSDAFCNLNNVTFRENDQKLKTVFYIGGQGEGSGRVVVSYGDASGLERREVFVDARDITKEDGMTDAEYEELLIQRGIEKTEDCIVSSSFECETLADMNFVYKRDYDLGDIVTVRKEAWGLAADLRITEIQEVYEQGAVRIVPTLGTPLRQTIDWSDS